MRDIKTADDFIKTMPAYTQNKLISSVLLLLDALQATDDTEVVSRCLAEDPAVNDLRATLFEMTFQLKDILNGGTDAIKAKHAELLAVEAALVSRYRTATVYERACDLTKETLLHFHLAYLIARRESIPAIDGNQMVADCLAFINETESALAQSRKKARIMARFPLRMTRQNYASHLRTAFQLLTEDLSASRLAATSDFFLWTGYPFRDATYEQSSGSFKERIEAVFFADFASFSEADFDRCGDEVEALQEDLTDWTDYLALLHEIVCYLSVLLTFAEDFETLFDGQLIRKDLYLSFKEQYHTEGFALIADRMKETLFDETERLLDDCADYEKRVDRLFNNKKSRFDDDAAARAKWIFEELNGRYSDTLARHLNLYYVSEEEANTPAEKAVTTACVERLTALLTESDNRLSNARNKLVRQLFLAKIPCFMSDEAFEDYLLYAYEGASKEADKFLISLYAEHILDDDDFSALTGDRP